MSGEEIAATNTTPEVLYLLLCREHRVSRSVRVNWFFNNLFKNSSQWMTTGCSEEEQDEDTTVKGDGPLTVLWSNTDRLTPSTSVHYIAQNASLIFVIDMTSSMMQVSNETFSVKLDEAVCGLEKCLNDLIQPMRVNKTSIVPHLCVTILVYNGSKKPVEMIVHGIDLQSDNISHTIALVNEKLNQLKTKPIQKDSIVSELAVDHCLEDIIKVSLQLLSRTDIKGIVLLTDGVGGFATPTSMHTIVSQLRTTNVSCWVVLCGGGTSEKISLGAVVDTQSLEHLTKSCNGCILNPAKILNSSSPDKEGPVVINSIQKCILMWSLQCLAWEGRVGGVALQSSAYEDPFVPQTEYKYQRSLFKAPGMRFIGCRIREGFLIKSISLNEREIEIVMELLWQPNVTIQYTVQTSFPLSDVDFSHSVITVSLVAPYHFVRDFLSESDPRTALPHATALRRFRQSLKSLTHCDEVLYHLLSFSSVSDYYKFPQSILDGMPLLTIPPNQSKPVLAINTDGEDKSLLTLANYWKSLSTLDFNHWTHWFHSYKIPLVLHQDSSLPLHILCPSPTGRYSSVQCRVSASKLYSSLRIWSTLVLQESHSYVRILPDPKTPVYFCIARLVQMQPCMLIHLGFLEGTPWDLQQEVKASLKGLIAGLKLSLATTDQSSIKGSRHNKKRGSSIAIPQQPCATLINKQLQRSLVSYQLGERGEVPLQWGYMNHHRWQWKVSQSHPQLLMALLRRRIQEGFIIASAHNGIVTLVVEVKVKQPYSTTVQSCLLQYVISPLSSSKSTLGSSGSFSTELWIEPQYQIIHQTPEGLKYLQEKNVLDAHYEIHSVDVQVLTALCSFLEYSPAPSPSVPSPLECEVSSYDQLDSGQLVEIQFNLSSLYPKSHVTAFTFSAFTERNLTASPITLDNCSPQNRNLHSSFIDQLLLLSCTSIPVHDSALILNRLKSSDQLSQFVKLFDPAHEGSRLLWRCFASSKGETLSIIFTPCFLCPTSDLTSLCLPLVVMVTNLSALLGPDKLGGVVEPLPPDTYIEELFKSEGAHETTPPIIKDLRKSLKYIHKLSYLHSLQFSLQQSVSVNEDDLKQGLGVCYVTSVPVDITPLLVGVCHHVCFSRGERGGEGEMVSSNSLSVLLELLGDQRRSSYRMVSLINSGGEGKEEKEEGKGEELCVTREEEVSGLLTLFLSGIGFKLIKNGRYFWLEKETNTSYTFQKEMTPTIGIYEDNEDTRDKSVTPPPFSPDTTLKPKPIPVPSHPVPASDSEDETWDLEPILSPTSDAVSPPVQTQTSPLFLELSYSLKHCPSMRKEEEEGGDERGRATGEESNEHERRGKKERSIEMDEEDTLTEPLTEGRLPLCLKSLLSSFQLKGDSHCSLQLNLTFYSLLDSEGESLNEEKEEEEEEEKREEFDPILKMQHHFQRIARSLKHKVEWLVQDEVLSRSRELVNEGEGVSPSLLQSVASHVQSSSGKYVNCLFNQEIIKFVFGAQNSMHQFLQQLEDIKLTAYTIHKASDDYFYLTPCTHSSSYPHFNSSSQRHSTSLSPFHVPNKEKKSLRGRCSTPSPVPAPPHSTIRHKRSVSWTASSSLPVHISLSTLSPLPTSQSRSSMSSINGAGTVDYYASRSNSTASFISPLSPFNNVLNEELFWIVMRVLPSKVEVYIHNRCLSKDFIAEDNSSIKKLCSSILSAISRVCKRTNQWHLLKELLDTHVCSPLLLPESQSDEWVRHTVSHHGDIIYGGERFYQQQFECERQWRHHITPHWRLRTMKNQTPLRITRNALNAFAVTNRTDIYVLQDVTEGGEETIFYLKISESLCEVEGDYIDQDEGGGEDTARCDTRATNEVETISISSVGELQTSKHLSSSSLSINRDTKPCESIVLELFGITEPTVTLKSRLQRVIQLKLDDAALELMCSSYTRNLRLYLSPADIEFLQPSPIQPSEVVSLLLPQWIPNPNAFFFYLLQQLSLMFLQPQYTSVLDTKDRVLLKTPPELSLILKNSSLPLELEQDYLFLHIRPVTKGRGMGLISASLVSPEGLILPPLPGIKPSPAPFQTPPILEQTTLVEIIESFPVKDSTRYSVGFHIWERGNVGLPKLKQMLVLCVQRSLLDTLFESHYLQIPVASISEEEIEKRLSPGLLRSIVCKTPSIDQGSFVNVTLDSSMEGSSTMAPPSVNTSGETMRNSSFSEINEEDAIEDVGKGGGGGGDWEQKEKLRRIQSTKENLLNQARTGLIGSLSKDYTCFLPLFLHKMEEFTSPILYHQGWTLPSNYSITPLLSHTISYISSSLSEMSFSLFKYDKLNGTFSRISLPSDKTPPKSMPIPTDFILIGRDLQQWKESSDPSDPTKHFEEVWSDALRCLPLASWKEVGVASLPLQVAAKRHNCFVPRHQFLMGTIGRGKFEVWLYNVSETRLRKLKVQLTSLLNWQTTRTGFLHQLLSQKMGLFHHTTGKDILPAVQLANKYCTTAQNIGTVVKQSKPPPEEISPATTTRQFSRSAPPTPQIELDSFYQDKQPLSPLPLKPTDPVTRHGIQFREMLSHQRETAKQKELLGKVFESWEQRGIDYSAPISTEVIAKLKRMSRLLHFCSSPLLFFPGTTTTQFMKEEGRATVGGASVDEQDSTWTQLLKDKFLHEYTSYLQTLKFHPINERPPASQPRSRHTPSPTHSVSHDHGSLGLYKCLQRSWSSGGIMLVELLFKGSVFHVMLYSIECSRLTMTHLPSFEVSDLKERALLFSQECGRMKDFIHVHSFTYDFHIRTILSIIQKRINIDGTLNVHHLLNRLCKHYQNPPLYIRNRICKETLSMTLSVAMESLMKHLLSNCKEYSLDTLELLHTTTNSSESATPTSTSLYEVALMIDLSNIGNVTTPEISRLIYDTREQYHVIVLAILSNGQSDSNSTHNKKSLSLSVFLILVNKVEVYPRLTVLSPLSSHNKVTSPTSFTLGSGGHKMETLLEAEKERESKLNASVRDHRRKLGYGSLNTPSAGSEVVINQEIIEEEMNGLKRHFTNIINSAQSHVRRNELWKRLLYGGLGNKIMEALSVIEFQELLQLVTSCRLETIDPQLVHFQKQTRKWYRGLFQLFEEKFHGMFKSFTSKANGIKYGVIINEDWQDMFLLLLLEDEDTSTEGSVYTGIEQGFSCVYRNPKVGVVSQGQRDITAYVEEENRLISAVVNILCGSLWAKMMGEIPVMAKSGGRNRGGSHEKL